MNRFQRLCKRVFDVVISAFTLLLLSPIFAVIAAAIKVDSPGPVIFVARRCGKDRRKFDFYKFRSMVNEAPIQGSRMLTVAGDRRVTRLGRFLRAWKLDELPQLFNVLRGDMSIVGPRPEVPEVVDQYYVEAWNRVLTVKPGMTCLLQIEVYPDFTADHKGVQDPETHYVENDLPRKLESDLYYVERRSLWLDAKVLAATIYCVLFRTRLSLRTEASAVDGGRTPLRHEI